MDSTISSFVDTVGTTTPLVGFNEIEITYLVATDAGWLLYLADESVKFVHYPANRVRKQFGLDQDILDDLSFLMESPTSVRPFLQHMTFDFWRQCFSAVTVPGSLREGLCTPAMHGYWQVVMTSFEQELIGSRGFSLIPPKRLGMVVSPNPRLLLPSKAVLAYANKQTRSTIFEWDEEEKGWYWHAGVYPPGWEKKVKVINVLAPVKKGPIKLKSASKPKFASKPKPAAPRPPIETTPASRTRGSKRKTTPHPALATEQEYVTFNFALSFQ